MSTHVTRRRQTETNIGTLVWAIELTETGKPREPTDEYEHDLHGWCWCQPMVETDVATGDHIYIHRRTIDSPHLEVD